MPSIERPNVDEIARITTFRVSPLLEMLVSLQSLLDPVRNPDWKETVRDNLGRRFFERLQDQYVRLHGGSDLIEFALDTGIDHDDIPAFLDRVEGATRRHFLFLMLGRIFPEETLPEQISTNAVERFLDRHARLEVGTLVGADYSWCDDVEQTQREVVSLWREYYEGVYRERLDDKREEVEASVREKRAVLEKEGGLSLLRHVTGMEWLPDPLPADTPYTELVYVPIKRFARSSKMYFGYGNITVLYDIRLSTGLAAQQEERKKRVLRIARALGDPNRLRILQLIAGDEYKFNGMRVAKHTGLSSSVVSRHLKQLREAELIEEHSPDNRNVLYRLRYKTLEDLSEELIRYLKEF